MTSRSRAFLAILCALPLVACTASSGAEPQWPVLEPGVWETRATRTLPGGKTESWTLKSQRCSDAGPLLRGYWGLGTLERAGCRFEPSRQSDTRFTVTSQCMVRGVGVVASEATVTVASAGAFDMSVVVHEGPREYRATQTARRVGACQP